MLLVACTLLSIPVPRMTKELLAASRAPGVELGHDRAQPRATDLRASLLVLLLDCRDYRLEQFTLMLLLLRDEDCHFCA